MSPAWSARYVAHVTRAGRPTRATLADLFAWYRSRGWAAYPSQRHVAERLRVDVRTVRRWTASLVADGLLDVTRHAAHHDPITGRWRRRTNRYRCRFQSRKTGTRPGKDLVRPSGHSCPHEVPSGNDGTARVPVVAALDMEPPGDAAPPPARLPGETLLDALRRVGRR